MQSPTFPEGTQFPITIEWPHRLFTQFTSTDETRWILNGVTIVNGHFYATNGTCLLKTPAPDECAGICVTIPNHLVEAIENEANEVVHQWEEDGDIQSERRGWFMISRVELYATHATFKTGAGLTLSADYILGTPPPFDKAIPIESFDSIDFTINAAYLIAAAQCLSGNPEETRVTISLNVAALNADQGCNSVFVRLTDCGEKESAVVMLVKKR